ncbi:reverse transcriptase [Gossypium australe]|uniref:Reverse transcriptase n=1 Tax=Gossypium australe TaxID=47621 RepID=A0A5B6X283_9ROSI|nr:reverse transcriptase [Gossypium australe]
MSQKDLNLRQHRWLELLKDYDLVIYYHPRKANVVADALSRKSLFALRAMNTQLMLSDDVSIIAELKARPIFLKLRKMIVNYKRNRYSVNQILIQNFKLGLIKILNEAHNGNMSIHPGSNKMYNDLKKMYW